LLTIGLHQFETEQIPLGGGRSRGLGVVKLEIEAMKWINPRNSEALRDYLQNLVNDDLQSYQLTTEQYKEYKKQWTTAFINKLNKYLPTSSDSQTVKS
jgi:CRISPR/Cas system CSM-associated protein Csm3 (group 7 of RAMP superfamily)